MAKSKIHPLWYSEFIPILFFISSIFAGLSLVIVLEGVGQRVFKNNMSAEHKNAHNPTMISLARVCAIAIFVYLFMTILVFLHGKDYASFKGAWGLWYLVEIIGFVFVPGILFTFGFKQGRLNLIRIAAAMSIVGIILNRLNISTISYNWFDNSLQFPTWMEIVVSVAVIFVQLLVFRWIVRRMPVYKEGPKWASGTKEKQIINN
jgi:Ni/Fe-hydrogenase subunit HybB-like protein